MSSKILVDQQESNSVLQGIKDQGRINLFLQLKTHKGDTRAMMQCLLENITAALKENRDNKTVSISDEEILYLVEKRNQLAKFLSTQEGNVPADVDACVKYFRLFKVKNNDSIYKKTIAFVCGQIINWLLSQDFPLSDNNEKVLIEFLSSIKNNATWVFMELNKNEGLVLSTYEADDFENLAVAIDSRAGSLERGSEFDGISTLLSFLLRAAYHRRTKYVFLSRKVAEKGYTSMLQLRLTESLDQNDLLALMQLKERMLVYRQVAAKCFEEIVAVIDLNLKQGGGPGQSAGYYLNQEDKTLYIYVSHIPQFYHASDEDKKKLTTDFVNQAKENKKSDFIDYFTHLEEGGFKVKVVTGGRQASEFSVKIGTW